MKRVVCIAVAGLLGLGRVAIGADWPGWRGGERTGYVAADEKSLERLGTPKVLWHVPVGNGLSSPVVAAGRVFMLDHQAGKEVAHAWEAGSGKEVWQGVLDEVHKDSQSPAGPRCTPVVDGERVYVQSCRGELRCLNAADGKVIWRTNYVKDFGATFMGEKGQAQGAQRHGNNGTPLVDGEHLIAEVGGPGAGVVCFEKGTGTIVWKSQSDVPGYAAPVIAMLAGERQLVCFTVEGLVGLNPETGKLLWRDGIKTQFARHVTTPVVRGDVVVVSSHQVGLIGVRVTKTGEGFKAERIYTQKDLAINFSSPVVVGGYLYGVGPTKDLICVEVANGRAAWTKDMAFAGAAGSAHAGMIVMGEKVLMLTDKGEAVLFAADATGYREISRVQVCGTTWCEGAYSDGVLYVRDLRELYAVRIAG